MSNCDRRSGLGQSADRSSAPCFFVLFLFRLFFSSLFFVVVYFWFVFCQRFVSAGNEATVGRHSVADTGLH